MAESKCQHRDHFEVLSVTPDKGKLLLEPHDFYEVLVAVGDGINMEHVL